jgi:hypothetical protein
MGDAFNAIDDRTGQIISWIGFKLGTCAVMRSILASIKDWVSQALNLVLHVKFRSNTVSSSFT